MGNFAQRVAAQKAAPAAAKAAAASTPAPAPAPARAVITKTQGVAPAKPAPVKVAPPAKPAAAPVKSGMESLAEEQAMTSYDVGGPGESYVGAPEEPETSEQSLTDTETQKVMERIAKVRALREQGRLGAGGLGTVGGTMKREGAPGVYGGTRPGLARRSLNTESAAERRVQIGGKPYPVSGAFDVAMPSKAEMGAPADFQRAINFAGKGYGEATRRLIGIEKERAAALKKAMGSMSPNDPGYDAAMAERIAASVDREIGLRKVQALRDQRAARGTLREYGLSDDEIEQQYGAASTPETPIPFK